MFHHYGYSSGQGLTINWGQNFDDIMFQVSKWSIRNLILYTFLMILYMFISPGQGQKNFWCQQKALITSTICCKFQTNLYAFWLYTQFLTFFHMYIAPGQGQTILCGQKPYVNRNSYFAHLLQVVASFKNMSSKSDFIHNLSWFYTCI